MEEHVSAVVVVCKELFGAGIKSICARECGSLDVHIMPRLEAARRFPVRSRVRLVMLDVDIVERSRMKRTIGALLELFPEAGLIVAASAGSRAQILEYLACGAHGVMFKDQPAKDIAQAVRVVMSGGVSIPSIADCADIGSPLPESQAALPVIAIRIHDELDPEPLYDLDGIRLSARQTAVLKLLVRGLSNKAIARELGLSEATVKVHNNAVFKALDVHNRASAVARILSREVANRRREGAHLQAV